MRKSNARLLATTTTFSAFSTMTRSGRRLLTIRVMCSPAKLVRIRERQDSHSPIAPLPASPRLPHLTLLKLLLQPTHISRLSCRSSSGQALRLPHSKNAAKPFNVPLNWSDYASAGNNRNPLLRVCAKFCREYVQETRGGASQRDRWAACLLKRSSSSMPLRSFDLSPKIYEVAVTRDSFGTSN